MSWKQMFAIVVAMMALTVTARAQEDRQPMPSKLTVIPNVQPDPRLLVRTLHQGSDFKPFADKQQWLDRAKFLREQVLIAAGLYPLPEKCDLKPVIHGRIDRGDYTVEKVFFQSYPGFYVSGNLYRPKGKSGPFPAVLCPHGHWDGGRFLQAKDADVQRQLDGGFEKDAAAARYILQARCANLAKLGCIVFHYDMVGYADSDPARFDHRKTFIDQRSEDLLVNIFGLQTWDSIRSIDFLLSLPDVDKSRIACTGASGGATQTFMLMAVDDRLTAAAPVCMISADEHQGGCVCENAPLLRLFTDNVELAATFAPRPFIHPTATGDWTAHFMEHGLPEIKATYAMFNAQDMVQAIRQKADHNYNLASREAVYNFFNTQWKLGAASPVREQQSLPIDIRQFSVYDAQHPRPADALDPAALERYLAESAAKQLNALLPGNGRSADRFRDVIGTALRHLTATDLPPASQVTARHIATNPPGGITIEQLLLGRTNSPEKLPAILFVPANPTGPATIVISPVGKSALIQPDGTPHPLVASLLAQGQIVLGVDLFLTGQLSAPNPAATPGVEFFTGYNRTVLANRVHDILTAIACLKARDGVRSVNLVGLGRSGPWCLLARALAGDSVARTIADANQFDFDKVTTPADENRLPGAQRYGGLWAFAALAAPAQLLIYNTGLQQDPSPLVSLYSAAGARANLRIERSIKLPDMAQFLR